MHLLFIWCSQELYEYWNSYFGSDESQVYMTFFLCSIVTRHPKRVGIFFRSTLACIYITLCASAVPPVISSGVLCIFKQEIASLKLIFDNSPPTFLLVVNDLKTFMQLKMHSVGKYSKTSCGFLLAFGNFITISDILLKFLYTFCFDIFLYRVLNKEGDKCLCYYFWGLNSFPALKNIFGYYAVITHING